MSAFTDAVSALTALRDIDPDDPQITSAQHTALAAFPGWGAIAPVFDAYPANAWLDRAADFADTFAELDLTESRRNVDTSFYTPTPLIEHMWTLLCAAGFQGGSVLDIGCGTGRFNSHKPDGLDVSYVGVDADPIAADIARLLHPQSQIITGKVGDASLGTGYAASIGNVPFSSATVYEPGLWPSLPLHTACVRSAVRSVAPGGYVIVVTSRHVLDGTDGERRLALSQLADLIAAVRLPSGYFAHGGTDVVADVLVLRVREHALQGRNTPSQGWPDMHHPHYVTDDDGVEVAVSGYWQDHPELVAGRMVPSGYVKAPLAVRAEDRDRAVASAFAHAAEMLPEADQTSPADTFADVVLTDTDGHPENSYQLIDGAVSRIHKGVLIPVTRASRELRALIELRDAALELIDAESDWDNPDHVIEPVRTRTAALYADYVDRFGPLNRGAVVEGKADPETGMPRLSWRTPTMGGFRRDPSYVQVLALEVFDRASGTAEPAPILLKRVNRRPQPVTTASTAGEALAISMGESRRVDLDRITGLLGLSDTDAALTALGTLVYRDPATRTVQTARDYLCGDVRAKLAAAKVAAAEDPAYLANVDALDQIQPEWLTATDIRIELGSPLLTARDVTAFTEDLFERRTSVSYESGVGRWTVDDTTTPAQAQATWGTPSKSPFQLLEKGLNSQIPVVTREEFVDGKYRTVKDQEETEAAVEALGRIAARFSTWVWEDPARAVRLEREYNRRFNAIVTREPNGDHLPFPRLAEGVTLWKWQRAWVDHALSTGAALAAHEVGLGKTLSALGLSITLRDMGLANRPCVAVPNHLIEQISAEAIRSFPAARFLIVTRDDLHKDSRRLFAARCATGDWDCVIFTHEGFTSIPANPADEEYWLEEQKRALEDSAVAAGWGAKATARAIRSLDGKLDKLRDRVNDPNTITFDQLGIDHISVDEADRFRRLLLATNSDGFSFGASQRATDLHLKVMALRRRRPNHPVFAAYSGTPFTNTLAEAAIWLTICAPHVLADAGLDTFDAWSAQFVRYETIIEMSPDGGGFRSKRRPAVIQNVPELRTMLQTFMHMVRADDVGIERPEPRYETIVADPSEVAREYMTGLVKRADDLRKRRVDPSVDNMLKVCNDGRLVALDTSLVRLPEEPGTVTKLVRAADNIARIYHQNSDRLYPDSSVPGMFQLVMCDLGTPRPGNAQTYGKLRNLLIERGLPADKVRFVHEATTPKARDALFATCRSGTTAVLLGSTSKCGYGTNLQSRLGAVHHLDLPWTAAAWEQRNGRAIRYGNHHDTVNIYSYVTERTLDGFVAGIIERKARGFATLYDMNSTTREIDDVGEVAVNFAEIKASASGNDLLLRQHQLQTAVRKLDIARATTMQNARLAGQRGHSADQTVSVMTERMQHLWLLQQHADQLQSQVWDFTRVAAACRSSKADDAWRSTRRAYVSHAINDDNRHVFASVHKSLGRYVLQIAVGRSQWASDMVGEMNIPGNIARRTDERFAEWLRDQTVDYLTDLDAAIATTSTRLAYWKNERDSAYAAADAVVFDRQAELDDLRAELNTVDAEIAEAVTDAA